MTELGNKGINNEKDDWQGLTLYDTLKKNDLAFEKRMENNAIEKDVRKRWRERYIGESVLRCVLASL